MHKTIPFDKAKTEEFQESYQKAKNERNNSFMFENREVDVTYASYLLQFIDSNGRFKK
tara:strand:- start:97 stop:270 length:174 start_codon:yes stop_codon:yes gene_type:complete